MGRRAVGPALADCPVYLGASTIWEQNNCYKLVTGFRVKQFIQYVNGPLWSCNIHLAHAKSVGNLKLCYACSVFIEAVVLSR